MEAGWTHTVEREKKNVLVKFYKKNTVNILKTSKPQISLLPHNPKEGTHNTFKNSIAKHCFRPWEYIMNKT